MSQSLNLLEFPDRDMASAAAAERVTDALKRCLQQQDLCSLVVSGGSTPGPCFDRLAETQLDWKRVYVLPSDERWVPPDHPDSNEKLVRDRLLVDRAAAGNFIPLYRDGVSPDQALPLLGRDIEALSGPFTCTLLGMGEDGHFASLFPDFDELESALEPRNPSPCVAVRTASSPHVRMSLTLARLLDSAQMTLLIFGAAKLKVLGAAAAGDMSYPITSLLKHRTGSLDVVWAP